MCIISRFSKNFDEIVTPHWTSFNERSFQGTWYPTDESKYIEEENLFFWHWDASNESFRWIDEDTKTLLPPSNINELKATDFHELIMMGGSRDGEERKKKLWWKKQENANEIWWKKFKVTYFLLNLCALSLLCFKLHGRAFFRNISSVTPPRGTWLRMHYW